MELNKCEGCIWFGRCHEDGDCESYDPVSTEEQEVIEALEYESELRMRHELYREQIAEQHS